MRNKIVLFITIILVILAVFSSFIAPFNPNLSDFSNTNLAPNSTHFFGSDFLGRDIFSRTLYGLKNSLIIGTIAGFIATIIAFLYASLSLIKPLQNSLQSGIDAFLSIPNILFILTFASITGGGIISIILVIALFSWMSSAKVFIGRINLLYQSPFIIQSMSLGASKFKVLFYEVLPNLKGLFLSLFAINSAHAISHEATLSFFGMAGDLNMISLGLMINESTNALFMGAWWVAFFPGFMLFLLIFCIVSITPDDKGIKI